MNRYEIRVSGHLDRRRARSLGCEELRLMPGDKSLLVFAALDQAALYGLLTRLRDAGLDLIAVEHVPASVPRRTTAQNAPPKEASNAAD